MAPKPSSPISYWLLINMFFLNFLNSESLAPEPPDNFLVSSYLNSIGNLEIGEIWPRAHPDQFPSAFLLTSYLKLERCDPDPTQNNLLVPSY